MKAFILLIVFFISSSLFSQETTAQRHNFFGNPQVMWSLQDLEIGGIGNNLVSISVMFPETKIITGFRTYIIFVPGQAGGPSYYHDGDGGSFRASLQNDDGSPDHRPNGVKLAETQHIIGGPGLTGATTSGCGTCASGSIYGANINDNSKFREIEFLNPIAVTANVIYHLVFENTSSSPTDNFVSLDALLIGTPGPSGAQAPLYNEYDFRVSYKPGASNWVDRDTSIGIVEFLFQDASTPFGMTYYEVSATPDSPGARASKWLDSNQDIMQTVTPTKNFTVNRLGVAAMHYDGSNSMIVSIRDNANTVLWSETIGNFPTGGGLGTFEPAQTAEFREVNVVPPLNLTSGTTYRVVLEYDFGRFTIPGSRDGTRSGYFDSTTTPSVGAASYGDATANTWTEWEAFNYGNTNEFFDISFYIKQDETAGTPATTISNPLFYKRFYDN